VRVRHWERVGVRVGMGQFVGVEDHCHEEVVPAALGPAELDCQAHADVGAVNLGIADEGFERDVRRGLALQAIPYPCDTLTRPPAALSPWERVGVREFPRVWVGLRRRQPHRRAADSAFTMFV
jgi:hypothetical protein